MSGKIRVRFAPSPTGFMHLGNVRAALMNYLFAYKYDGTFILRIEDTDTKRNMDHARLQILHDLEWLTIDYHEGPLRGGSYGPYLQSERIDWYQEKLLELIEMRRVYRCFCSLEQLEKKRQQQIAAGKPPRYDRTCLNYSDDKIKAKINANLPFIWRFHLNEHQVLDIKDKAKETVSFDMKNFSDFAISREDGSFTFVFVNFVDDWLMKISHVIRGGDHMSNTALQAALYDAFAVKMPIFWHLPLICNLQGEKLSKRDFGFSLLDLKLAGFLPQAICNYLAIIGGSFKQEIQTLQELAQNFNFDHVHSSDSIKYDLEKLTWVNHQWILKLTIAQLVAAVKPFIQQIFPQSIDLDEQKLHALVQLIQPELKTLKGVETLLSFYFTELVFDKTVFIQTVGQDKAPIILEILNGCVDDLSTPDIFLEKIKVNAKALNISTKEIFSSLRYLLCGTFHGISIKELLHILDLSVTKKRIQLILK